MLEFLNRLKSKKIETDISERAQWLGLVDAIASDNEPEESATLETLERLGKSVDDLGTAVALLKQRRQWAAEMDAVPAAKAELAKIEAERTAAKDELNVAIQKHNSRIDPLVERSLKATLAITTADIARGKLGGTCTDARIRERLNQIRDAISPLNARFNMKSEVRGSHRSDVPRYEATEDADNLERTLRFIRELDAEIAQLEREIQTLQNEAAELHAEALDPLAL